ncbi:MAG: hypothetical protein WBL20_14365 [Sphingobium sp.]|uniref:hypothetical protein n=1 Tax=Sphingobium sp. TaxID=1912891 RepID=UPI002E1A6C66
MMSRLIHLAQIGRSLLSDRHVELGAVEFRIALAQAIFVGAPIILVGIIIMAALP